MAFGDANTSFDLASVEEAAGLKPDTISLTGVDPDSDKPTIHNDDLEALQRIAGVAPTGVAPTTLKTEPVGTTPDYLAPLLVAKPEKLIPERDWNAIYSDRFGRQPEPDTTVTQDSFEDEMVQTNAKNDYLEANKKVLDDLTDQLDGKVDEVSLVEQSVRDAFTKSGFSSENWLKDELQVFIVDGQLTEKGTQRLQQVKGDIQKQIKAVQDGAVTYASQQLTTWKNEITALNGALATFSPAGVKFPEELKLRLADRYRSGESDERYIKATPEQKAQINLLKELVLDEYSFGEFIRLLDERGQRFGVSRKLASQLNS